MIPESQKIETVTSSGINSIELWLLGCVVGSYVAAFMWVGFTVKDWRRLDFLFACAACILVFIQFLIRYLAITHVYKTENTIGAWVASFLIFVVSTLLVLATLNIPIWFVVLGALLLLASIKNVQSRRKILRNPNYNAERIMRLKEYMIMEMAFGFFMMLFSVFTVSSLRMQLSISFDSTLFFGTLFALFYSFVAVLIMIARVMSNRTLIESQMAKLR